MLYHISNDVMLGLKTFKPRVPKNRVKSEDNQIKRICFAGSIEDCFTSYPYKERDYHKITSKPRIFSVYELEEIKSKILRPEEIVEKVPDALETKEHWVLEKVAIDSKLIRVSNLKFERLNSYTNMPTGKCIEVAYDEDLSKTNSREFDFTLIGRKDYKGFKKILEKNNCKIKKLNVEKKLIGYKNTFNLSNRKREIYKLTYIVPKNISARYVWLFESKFNHKYRKITMS